MYQLINNTEQISINQYLVKSRKLPAFSKHPDFLSFPIYNSILSPKIIIYLTSCQSFPGVCRFVIHECVPRSIYELNSLCCWPVQCTVSGTKHEFQNHSDSYRCSCPVSLLCKCKCTPTQMCHSKRGVLQRETRVIRGTGVWEGFADRSGYFKTLADASVSLAPLRCLACLIKTILSLHF